ncbi:PREDICTED: uncharacterized protein LOC105561481 [Vollenhovia emeryi]|uniref:uncharacterized protein LOC105561481 n=1 Tax=Vollenhovia emeryi TaxID=411798 RepID=UPI0005F36A04|nr:PREDICTED: uncharacterized protein LOC105561481 [Vollenhovia emeryi]
MFKKHKIKSRKKMSRNHSSKMSVESNNLSLLTSNVNSSASIKKSKCTFSSISSATPNKNYTSSTLKQPQLITKAPKDAAVHFGNFYGLWDDIGKAHCNNHWNNHLIRDGTANNRPHRLEFTRQMVHKLERVTDTEDYMRQVSVLLKKTVEPPDFRLNQLPSRNSIPNGSRSASDYPLWYKEPHKISLVYSNPIAQP